MTSLSVQKISNPRGTSDILPDQISRWRYLENLARQTFIAYNYQEIRTPIFEETALFNRSLGQTSDVVQKQMLNLQGVKQRDGEAATLSLRPEGTAAIVRSYLQHHFDHKETLSKLYYIGPMFRGERPQKGRLRQFHQIGAEAIGPSSAAPFLDVEMIRLAVDLLSQSGLDGYQLRINSLGTPEDKASLSQYLRDHLRAKVSDLCVDCQQRFERNVFRLLDCKNKDCQLIVHQIPLSGEYLSAESRAYFSEVKEGLSLLKIPFEVSSSLVRGLDYYTHTVFEISHPHLGSQDALGAGGRYNNLVADLGGDPQSNIGGIGFALGMERMLLAQMGDCAQPLLNRLDAFVVTLDPQGEARAYRQGVQLLHALRLKGMASDMNYVQSSMKSQMRLADKLKARYVLILGENELKEKKVTIKEMDKSIQSTQPIDQVVEFLLNQLTK